MESKQGLGNDVTPPGLADGGLTSNENQPKLSDPLSGSADNLITIMGSGEPLPQRAHTESQTSAFSLDAMLAGTDTFPHLSGQQIWTQIHMFRSHMCRLTLTEKWISLKRQEWGEGLHLLSSSASRSSSALLCRREIWRVWCLSCLSTILKAPPTLGRLATTIHGQMATLKR